MNSLVHFEHGPRKTALVKSLLSRSFSMCPMATILFSTSFVKSREFFENKRHGYSCSENICKVSRSEMFEKVNEQSLTPKFEFFWIFRRSMKNGLGQGFFV